MRQTSRLSFYECMKRGTLPYLQRLVYAAVRAFGPGTARELCEKADIEGGWKRFSELERMGMIEVVGRRRCSETGRTAIVWGVRKPPPRRSRST